MSRFIKKLSLILGCILAMGVFNIPSALAEAVPYVKSDTTTMLNLRQGESYTLKFSADNFTNQNLTINVGNSAVLQSKLEKKVGNDYYFKVTAIGNIGSSSGIYTTISGQRATNQCEVKILDDFGYSEASNVNGNTSSNLTWFGTTTQQGDWVYYNSYNELFKMKSDGTEKTRLKSFTDCSNLNVVGDSIYYSYYSDPANAPTVCGIYKMNTDGSDVIKVSNDACDELEVICDQMYFVSNFKLYRMNLDGTSKIQLADNVNRVFTISDNWIYYIKRNNDNREIFKIRTNGTSMTKISNINDVERINTVGDYIYFDRYYSDGFYRIGTNGANYAQLSKSNLYGWNVTGNWIYYTIPVGYYSNLSNQSNKLYRMCIDGTNNTKLTNYGIGNFNIVNDWIYFSKIDSDDYCRLRIDGSNLQIINTLVN